MDTRLVLGASLTMCLGFGPTGFSLPGFSLPGFSLPGFTSPALGAYAGLASNAVPSPNAGELIPRRPHSKIPTERLVIPVDRDGNIVASGRLLVKFHDSIQARTGVTRGNGVQSLNAENLRGVEDVLAEHRLTIRQAITRAPEKLRQLEIRAENYSSRAQPDLAGMMYIEGPLDRLLLAAHQLNAMPTVEWVEFEREMRYHLAPSPVPLGEPAPCGDPAAGDCFSPNPTINCDDEQCCQDVGAFFEVCTEEQFGGSWDIFCVNLANLFCTDGDRCETQLVNAGCFDAHQSPGCNNSVCCNAVADIEPFCIDVRWDDECAALASQLCGVGDPDTPSPNFAMNSSDATTRLQKYTTPEPSGPGDAFFDRTGFSGDGLDIAGLEGLGQTLLDVYGVGEVNGARGFGIRVGVVEHAAYVTGEKGGEEWHEDLLDVIPEPGQTILTIIGGVLDPSHGTAVLSQIVAADNGQGVSGIARDAQGYFFPIVSVEEGGRTLNAITSALELFDAGDVLNYSIGPGGAVGTLVSDIGTWTLVNLGTDLGITSVISAGNSCGNLDGAAQAEDEDSGAIIVGACFPGAPDGGWPFGLGRFCRLGFSNHCRDCEDSDIVHVSAWGRDVMSAGYGDLFGPVNAAGTGINYARSYTAGFSGTSSAAPIIAGYVACLQGLAKQFYGTPIPPRSLRDVVVSTAVYPQCDSPNPPGLPGSTDIGACGFDFNPDEEARLIGGFPRAFVGGVTLVTSNFFSASPLTDVKVITGRLLSGNVNSLKAIDNTFLSVRTRKTSPGAQGAGTPPAITYLTAGETTDIEVTARTLLPPEEVVGLALLAVLNAQEPFVLVAMYAYNHTDRRWTFIPQIEFTGPGGSQIEAVVQNPEKHVNELGQVKVRVWTCGLGAVPSHVVFYDFVDVAVTQVPIFEPEDP